MKKHRINCDLPVILMKEGNIFVCYTPFLDLASHGDTVEDALDSFRTTLRLFIEEVTKMGTWDKVLTDCGWQKVKNTFMPPEIIGQKTETMNIPAFA